MTDRKDHPLMLCSWYAPSGVADVYVHAEHRETVRLMVGQPTHDYVRMTPALAREFAEAVLRAVRFVETGECK
jgi:hypothetical protein